MINNSRDTADDATQTGLNEDATLALLKRPDLQADFLTRISRDPALLKSRKVKLALVKHPRTPRHVVLPLLRSLFTFDLMRVALTPALAADVKVAAEDSLINRLEKLSLGEKVSLARRGSARITAALLNDSHSRVIETALENGRLTESRILKEVSRQGASVELILALCIHPKWSLRSEIAAALLGNENTPPHLGLKLAESLPKALVGETLAKSRLSDEFKQQIQDALAAPGRAAE